ncbi:transglutaminase TgpA family protein [Jeotgalibacillus salarius]|uniref:DUF4129 domain-containing protein n=1 Tax=Jeotgalibacillus salarius TaxID=546023 RepID=A0A4Y8LDT4_9BACL|nr:transglutaminaseTgpA domain-containing protein [Jeotgalibacillus salarius]TFE00476.1 DUF4129 domain-containing protein [Jeotgalibacillus salarius]
MKTDYGWEDVATLILYVLSFFLLWEWLRPVEQITETANVHFFIIFAGLSLLLYYFELNWIISGAIKAMFILVVLQYLYFDVPFFGEGEWFGELTALVGESVVLTVQQNWSGVSDLFRSLLFFVLLWLTAYLMHYWLAVRKQMFLFYLFTVVYITILDTFSPYDGSMAIVRVILFGFMLMGLLGLQRMADHERITLSMGQLQKWLIPLAALIAFSSAAAYAAPKSEPIWPDPVPFLTSFSDGSGVGSGGVNRLGYGVDDSELGGSFVGDETKVFEATVQGEQYWRIETKDTYTGKGWEQSREAESLTPFSVNEAVPLTLSAIDEESETQTVSVDVDLTYNHLVYPYAPDQVINGEADELRYNPVSDKVTSYEDGDLVELSEYEWEFREPRYSLQALRNTTGLGENAGSMEQYLQLPENVPERIRELSLDITESEDNWYDKAKAVEGYFSRSGFVYEQEDVPVPEGNEDYVDQFLFETQRGYCDNYSTAMVVMLRSIDIPARWVKGYTGGEVLENLGDGRSIYEVTNNNAHSWVEVFFPEIGWVPFEPTVSFSNNISLNYDLDLDTDDDTTETPEPAETPEPESPEPLEEDTGAIGQVDEDGSSGTGGWTAFKTFISENRLMLFLVSVLLVAVGTGLYRNRNRWMPYVLIRYYRSQKGSEVYPKAYSSLLKQLRRYGLRRKETQTLRAYAKEVDNFFGTHEMSRLTDQYERILYRSEDPKDKWSNMRELWEDLIKKTTG